MTLNPKTLLGAALLLVAAVLVIWKILPETPQVDSEQSEGAPAVVSADRQRPKRPPVSEPRSAVEGSREAEAGASELLDEEAQAAAKEAILEKIEDAAVTYDPVSLPIIRPYLESPDPELREAAVDAMLVLGDESAGQMLREAAMKLESTEEAAAMMEAAAWVELPPANLTRLKERAKEKAEKEAAEAGGAPVPDGAATPEAPSAPEE